ncbi:DNA-binding PadR family transcriptional regulator [Microbacterium terrae]|uniref:Transcriptional regulator YqjI n=1 Tax=Microbacterium terrae TaxID=69369 RepID=A0A0M2H2N0_9MICO|nr:PadR family transcriptional regulator [Microbacterium terrae]KJL37714.1 Transcriptional regulator YqjI [Microbacterium terrae]MBP1076546.1 DNA-binding PadR family transcriptional regulator [Microbacterium terrae]GLJ97375.1 transcriptional regulator [Microbacterium terrae]
MNGQNDDGRFGAGHIPGANWGGQGLWDALDQLREGFEQRFGGAPGPGFGSRMGRGDVRAAVLALLAEQPMHGYQIIHEIEQRSGGLWKPSPGSVYPTLQMLSDEGLISAEESGGKKVYSLTESGRTEAEGADQSAPWESAGMKDAARATALPKAGAKLAQAAATVGRTGTSTQVAEAVAVLDDARRKLYAILAQE